MSIGYLYFLLTLLPGLKDFLGGVSILGMFFWLVCAVFFVGAWFAHSDEEYKIEKKMMIMLRRNLKYMIIAPICFIMMGLVSEVIPSKSDIAQIYVVNYVTTHNDIKEIPEYLIKFIKKEDS